MKNMLLLALSLMITATSFSAMANECAYTCSDQCKRKLLRQLNRIKEHRQNCGPLRDRGRGNHGPVYSETPLKRCTDASVKYWGSMRNTGCYRIDTHLKADCAITAIRSTGSIAKPCFDLTYVAYEGFNECRRASEERHGSFKNRGCYKVMNLSQGICTAASITRHGSIKNTGCWRINNLAQGICTAASITKHGSIKNDGCWRINNLAQADCAEISIGHSGSIDKHCFNL